MAGEESEAPEALLVSDAERNAAVERLNASFADGRLTHEEYSDRLDEIYRARTDVDLAASFRGLPRLALRRPSKKPSLRIRAEHLVEASSPAIICTAIWAMTSGPHGYFWPMWVWLPTGMSVIGGYLGSSGKRRRREERQAWLATEGYLNPDERDHHLGGRADGIGRADRWTVPPPTVTVPATPEVPQPGSAPSAPSSSSSSDDVGTRAILSVVFIDIVGSTESAAAMGDRRWRERLEEFRSAVDDVLDSHRGAKVFTKGDEVVATFASAARAISYARDVRAKVASLELRVRAGIHTGEVEGTPGDQSGITLHIGQRVSDVAAADEILVSSTVRDIAYGSGIAFVDHGEHELRGLTGRWHLYLVGDG